MGADTKTVDVLAVIAKMHADPTLEIRHAARLYEIRDAITTAMEAMRNAPCFCVDADDDGDSVTCDRCAALRAVGGAE